MSNYIFVVSAPSGAGKTSLLKKFLSTYFGKQNFIVATSHTTRLPRIGEINGKEYHFTSVENFEKLINNNGFVEYAKVFTNYYGTSVIEVDKLLAEGKNIILEIDWQGARQARDIYKDKCKSLFILPPSLAELENRLKKRETDSIAVIAHRMEQAESEISHASEYDMSLINDDFAESVKKLENYFRENIK
jgi:guanylate kinase